MIIWSAFLAPPGGFEPPTFRLGGERYYPAELRRHIQFTENTVGTPAPYNLPKIHQKVPNRVPNSWRRNCKLVITPFFSCFRRCLRVSGRTEQHLRRRTLYPAELRGHDVVVECPDMKGTAFTLYQRMRENQVRFLCCPGENFCAAPGRRICALSKEELCAVPGRKAI